MGTSRRCARRNILGRGGKSRTKGEIPPLNSGRKIRGIEWPGLLRRCRVVDQQLHLLVALPAVDPEMPGNVQRQRSRLQQRFAQRRLQRPEGNRFQPSSVSIAKLDAFREFLTARAADWLEGGEATPVLSIDGALRPGGATLDLLETLGRVGPFGVGNPEPRFAFPAARILGADVVGENHVRCQLGDADGRRLKAIAFRALETPLGEALLKARSLPLHIAGHLRIDRWQGNEKVQLLIDDAASAQ